MASGGLDGAGKGSVTRFMERSNDRALLQSYASDPKYKKYTQQVEKCLSAFDNVHEWADFIAFLKQLLKTLQAYMQFKDIPRKAIVAKRLSQCLNPALPSGVHQRALDVYTHILGVVGSEGLKRDLFLWASGLFPFFEYSATSVKPTLLNIYDTYFLPLQAGLRPVMKSFILALLPGLEEETGEFFDKVLTLLDRLSGTVSPSFFFQNVWLAMLTTPSARGTSLNLLSRRLPKFNADDDISSSVGQDVGLMIRAFSAALEDDNLLVRRGALDLLLQALRFDHVAVRKASAEDSAILMRAATGVVLRRDLSLNRRLYSWLLGSDENPEHQATYFRNYSLELLRMTLREEMFSPSMEYSESRPFKIFISLMDKWEIGGPLTEVLVLDTFRALKVVFESGAEVSEDVVLTASTLYEAVEPSIVWKQLLPAIMVEVHGDGKRSEAARLAQFILTSIHVRDDEIQSLHLPIVFNALLEVLQHLISEDATKASLPIVTEVLRLSQTLLERIPTSALMKSHEAANDQISGEQGSYSFACVFYGIDLPREPLKLPHSPRIPFVAAFEDLVAFSLACGKSCAAKHTRQLFVQSLLLLSKLLEGLEADTSPSVDVQWNPSEWLSSALAVLEVEDLTFTLVDSVVSLAVALQQSTRLQPTVNIQDRAIMFKVVRSLTHYLRPAYSTYHARAVNLIWALENSTQRRYIESIIAQGLTSPESRNNEGSYEAFGVLWRLTEDNMLPGFAFKVPLMIVLDTLKNDDPHLRRVGETWMRCSLKSYLRVLDPLLFDLLDPSLRRTPSVTRINGKQLQGYSYECAFDQSHTTYVLEILLSVVKFGGQGFGKTAGTSLIRRSHHAGLVDRVQAAGVTHPDATYQDVLVEVLTRFLQSECKHKRVATMEPMNTTIQSTAIDLLQAIVARGEIDVLTLDGIQAAVIGKLYLSVHTRRLELQNKLLHLLHSVISATTASQGTRTPRPPNTPDGLSERLPSHDDSQEPPGFHINPLLIQTLIDGLAILSNRAVLQHWLDFILMTIPQFQNMLHAVVSPLSDCVGRQLHSSLADIRRVLENSQAGEDLKSMTTDAEVIMLLNALERLVLLSLSAPDVGQPDEDEVPAEKPPTSESGGFLGIVTNVFSSESAPIGADEQLTIRSPGYRSLHDGIRVLFSVWTTTAWPKSKPWMPQDESLSQICSRSRTRCRRVFEHFFRIQSAEVLESIIECWYRDNAVSNSAAFELVDTLTSSAQTVVHMVCESVSYRVSGLSERTRRQVVNPNVSDAILLQFLEQYLGQLEGPLVVQVWGRFMQLAKDVIANVKDFKNQVFPVLRCVSVLADKMIQTTAMEDRRIRKELQDSYGKLLDTIVLSVSRSDQTSWMRRGQKDMLPVNGRDSPLPRAVSELKLDEKASASSSSLPLSLEQGEQMQIVQYVANTALPRLRKFLMDNDKMLTACTNIMYYIVTPVIKGKNKPLDIESTIFGVLREMSRLSAALKAWRGVVSDILSDNRFFNSSSDAGSDFRSITRSWIDTDKTAFPEFLGKITTAPSTNIFANREYENLLRSLNLRRLSYLLLCGEKNQFLTSLPTIQEKLVDVLRNLSAPIVQAEVYLCVRVLLCRLSPHNLDSFWPVVLSELYRLFDQIIAELPSDGSDTLTLVLAACKLMDLLLVIQTEEFQVHQWAFVTDNIDAVYRPDEIPSEAMFDQLAEIASRLPAAKDANQSIAQLSSFPTPAVSSSRLRKPMLNGVRQVDSIRDLVPFLSGVSIASYESVYTSGGNVDWEEVERGLLADMFEGQ
ncbi:hypothetical protein FA95DRAFT_1536117 [Auriscalpium vulgare]|uniref:Uncharacterized protein n=1 Tax=Auriscalpium vulgare TaxID=40419 RepID=A0ACB8S493_9AGAM|nr:hypothetical protein FA95DRAFT_1536117 [Auriscalpium vulgare]